MDAEVVVVGAGIVGASIALQLARRDVGGVLLVDAGGPAAGMSGRSFRQVRTHYSNEVTTRLARRGYRLGMARIGAVLIDIDGVLTVSWQPLEGAVAALRRLRAAALPLDLVTNTTSRTRASIASAFSPPRSSPPPTCGSTTRAPGACCSTTGTSARIWPG